VVVCALLLWRADLTISWISGVPYLVATLLMIGVRLATRRGAGVLLGAGRFLEYAATFMLLSLVGAVTSYPIAALTHGYADGTLQSLDRALAFDWLAWYRTVAASRALQVLGTVAYENIYFTPAVLLAWFAFDDKQRAAYAFLFTFWLTAAITLVLFSFMPALGPLAYLWRGPVPYMPVSELYQLDLIPALRAHRVHMIDLNQLRGIVSAPSFHAAAAAIYIRTAWRTPPLRWPLLAANTAMLAATPVEGTHYLSDLILGAIVASVAISVVDRWLLRSS
jgi:hypothetical protein